MTLCLLLSLNCTSFSLWRLARVLQGKAELEELMPITFFGGLGVVLLLILGFVQVSG